MSPEAPLQSFPPVSSTLNSRNPLGYNFVLKDSNAPFYGNPRYDLLPQSPNNLVYPYYSNLYTNSSLYPSTNYIMNNRSNFMEMKNPLPLLNNSVNPFIIKESLANPFENLLSSPTCPPVLKRNPLLSNELNSPILSPIILSETRNNVNLIKKKEKEQLKYISPIMSENIKNFEKKKNGNFESLTNYEKQLSIEVRKKVNQLKNRTKKERLENNIKKENDLIYNINQKSKQYYYPINTNKIKKNSFSNLPLKGSFSIIENSSPVLNNTYSPSLISTPLLNSPCSSSKSFSYDDIASNSTFSDDHQYQSCLCSTIYSTPNTNLNTAICSTPNTNLDTTICSTLNSNSNHCESPAASVSSSCSDSISTVINISLNKKPKRRGGNSKGRKRPNHPHKVTRILKEWLANNSYPYPSNTEKSRLCDATGLTMVRNLLLILIIL
ncbi:hypothetical protein BCR36DRAFT_357842 [Piromyces finnis]|uniref:KN homeodomain domain-containing protein n=1 Tax=Piromyces finnis TaxID=1754191 RepID=A0A1Y1V2B5_9FUNG|nr:hypothetical protein BCR36DRAFT_357842 [Piromyces finnis]|eukprot:ORX45753.1 hypothetical protein BCR36DRAFT_357842 [Piromyces finnis]